jgi:hypothetical protein
VAATGLSLGSSSEAAGNSASLVGIQGSSYATVALLDFGGQNEEGQAGRQVGGLGNRHPLGEVSPLMRFVTGQEEALQQHRNSTDRRLPAAGDAPQADPWSEDLFHRQGPAPPPRADREQNTTLVPGHDEAFCMWPWDRAESVESPVDDALAVLIAGTVLAPVEVGCGQRRRRAVR